MRPVRAVVSKFATFGLFTITKQLILLHERFV